MKKFYTSKVLWVNLMSFIALIIQIKTGKELFSLEYQGMALAVINAILRTVTNVPLQPVVETLKK